MVWGFIPSYIGFGGLGFRGIGVSGFRVWALFRVLGFELQGFWLRWDLRG